MTIQIEGLSVSYGPVRAVVEVSACIQSGELTAIIGANGSGKSSLLKAIAGLIPHVGLLQLGETNTGTARIGYMPQDTNTRASLTVLETVLLGRLGKLGLRITEEDLEACRAVLGDLGLLALAPRYIGELSGGQRQLAFLAQALASNPEILLLDEPISALDIRHQLEVMETVAELTSQRGLTTLVILHDLNAASRYADKIAVMHQASLIALGTPQDVLNASLIERAFEVAVAVIAGADGLPVIVPQRTSIRRNAA